MRIKYKNKIYDYDKTSIQLTKDTYARLSSLRDEFKKKDAFTFYSFEKLINRLIDYYYENERLMSRLSELKLSDILSEVSFADFMRKFKMNQKAISDNC